MPQQDDWRYLYTPRIAQAPASRRPVSSRVRRRPREGAFAPRPVVPFPGPHLRAAAPARKPLAKRKAKKGGKGSTHVSKQEASSTTGVAFTKARKRELAKELRGAKKQRRKHGFDAVARALATSVLADAKDHEDDGGGGDDDEGRPRRPQSARVHRNNPLRMIHDFIMAEVVLLDSEGETGTRKRGTTGTSSRCEDDVFDNRGDSDGDENPKMTLGSELQGRKSRSRARARARPSSAQPRARRSRQRPQSALPLGRSPVETRTVKLSFDTSLSVHRRERPRSAFVPSTVRRSPTKMPATKATRPKPRRGGRRRRGGKGKTKGKANANAKANANVNANAKTRQEGQERRKPRLLREAMALAKTTLEVGRVPQVSPTKRYSPRPRTAAAAVAATAGPAGAGAATGSGRKRGSPRGEPGARRTRRDPGANGGSFEAALRDLAPSSESTTSSFFPSRGPSSRFVIQTIARARKADVWSLDFAKLGQLVKRAREKKLEL